MYSYNGIGEVDITLKNKGMSPGCVSKVGANDAGYWCDNGDVFHGVCLWERDGNATMQVRGFIKMPYSGATAPTVGYCELVADGNGYVKAYSGISGNVPRLVVAVDTTEHYVTFLL